MKKTSFFKLAAVATMAVFLFNCQPDNHITLNPVDEPSPNVPFADMSDTTTTDIVVSIPRIELNTSKSTGNILTMYVSVTDQDGNVLANFNEHNFNLAYVCKGEPDTTNIVTETIDSGVDQRDKMAVGNTMDYSGSMSSQDIADMEKAVRQFIRLKDDDDYMQIIKFHTNVFVMNEFTNDTLVLLDAVDESVGGGRTAYFRAVIEGLDNAYDFTEINQDYFPAVIAFTDGYNNEPPYDPDDVTTLAQSLQIPVYTVGFGNVNEAVMQNIAENTGGRYLYTPDSDAILDLYEMISGQLSNIYSVQSQILTIECDELTIIVEVVYQSANGVHVASSSRDINTSK